MKGIRFSCRVSVAVLMATMAALIPVPAAGADLSADAVAAWDRYVRVTETRRTRELADGRRFLALDFRESGARVREALLRGEVIVDENPGSAGGTRIRVPDGTIHHWRAAVFVRGVRLEALLIALRNPRQHGYEPQDVLEWRLLERDGDRERVFLRLQRQEIVTAVFNTEHDVQFTCHGPDRASSRSVATRIAEIADGTEKPAGRDRGFLWRLNSYWRYEEVAGGVLVELESLTLSRDVPSVLAPIAGPLIRRVARESILRTLEGLRDQLGQPRQAS